MDTFDRRLVALDEKIDRLREDLSQRMERIFQWTTGINVALWSTILVAMIFRK